MRSKSGLTFRLAHYLAEVQRTFMLTYVLFMLVIQCHFPQFADKLRILVLAQGLLQVLQNIEDLNLQVVLKIVIKNYIVKSDAKIYFSADCGHGWHFKSICTALLAKYFEMKKESTWWAPHLLNEEQKYTHRKISNRVWLTKMQEGLVLPKGLLV